MKVFVYSSRQYDQPVLKKVLGAHHEISFTEQKLNFNTASLAAGFDAVSVFTSDDCSAPVLDILHELGIRYIALRSAGFDHVNLKRADELGMLVANVPDYSPYSIAEHAVALLLAMNRKIIEGQIQLRAQDFRVDTLKGFDIHGKRVGIIGTGKIGMAFARIMRGFGAEVVAYDVNVNPQAINLDIKYTTLQTLLNVCDIISVHCPLNETTRHLLSDTAFNGMKQGAILINTARGAIIDTKALIRALEKGKLGGACLDVYENEKGLFFENWRGRIIEDEMFVKLRSFSNVLMTCHQGFLTEEALEGIVRTTLYNLNCWVNLKTSANELHFNTENAIQHVGITH